MRSCDQCNATFTSEHETQIYCALSCRQRAKRQRKSARRMAQDVYVQLYCRGCGQLFETRHKQIRYCTDDCKKFYQKQARRDRRAAGYRVDSKTLRMKVYEESNGKCQLCGDPIDLSLSYPNKNSFSVDHIIPRSLGGGSGVANLQAAHLQCNRKKGATLPSQRDRH